MSQGVSLSQRHSESRTGFLGTESLGAEPFATAALATEPTTAEPVDAESEGPVIR